MSLFAALLLSAVPSASVLIPPHGRVNSQCYSAWNADKSDLDVVWNEQRYSTPWTFNVEVTDRGCEADECVQRLWCTETGAVGRYITRNGKSTNVSLEFTWLLDTTLRSQTNLSVLGRDGLTSPEIWLHTTSDNGPATVIVVGDTLYYFSFYGSDRDYYAVPHLSAIQFDAHRDGATADQLWRYTITAFNMIGYTGVFYYTSASESPMYLAGPDSITVSMDDFSQNSDWTIDAVLLLGATDPTRYMHVHALGSIFTSTQTSGREFMSVPGFACRAYSTGATPFCYRTAQGGKYTWATSAQTALGLSFRPIASAGLSRFNLPATLWLHEYLSWLDKSQISIVTNCLGSLVAFDGATFWGVEARANASCATGKHLVLASYDVSASVVQSSVSDPIVCANDQVFPEDPRSGDVPYAMTAVKWIGPFQKPFKLFVAVSVSDYEYCPLTKDFVCALGQYFDGNCSCLVCPAGYRCDGKTKTACAPGTYSVAGQSACTLCSAGSYSGEAAAECTSCPSGSYQPAAGQSSCPACASGSFTSLQNTATSASVSTGARYCVQCPAGSRCNGQSKSLCGAGTYSGAGKATCTQCPAGTSSGTVGATSAAACVACAKGTYSVSGATLCTDCPAGTAGSQTGAASASACVACGKGFYSSSHGSSSCLPCPNGYYAGTEGQTTCLACTGGTQFTDAERTVCNTCPAGQIASADHLSCTKCPAGTAVAPGRGCVECPGGTYASVGFEQCLSCAPGTHSGPRSESCQPCQPGTFQGASGSTECVACPAGTQQPDPGGVRCAACPPGRYAEEGWPACALCPAGFFCTGPLPPQPCDFPVGTGAAACAPCPPEQAWFEGVCRPCSALPAGYVCVEDSGGGVSFSTVARVRRGPGQLAVQSAYRAGCIAAMSVVLALCAGGIAFLLLSRLLRRKTTTVSDELIHV